MDGVVAVGPFGLELADGVGPELHDGHGDNFARRIDDLGHPQFFTYESINHCLYRAARYSSLISTSTPAAKSSLPSASMVCWVGSSTSSSRLWVRTSKCSRDFLSTCGERLTVKRSIRVGNGIGPATRPPVRRIVSTISRTDWSSSR